MSNILLYKRDVDRLEEGRLLKQEEDHAFKIWTAFASKSNCSVLLAMAFSVGWKKR